MGEETEGNPAASYCLAGWEVRRELQRYNFLERFISQVGKEFLAIQWLKSFWFLISNPLSIHTSVKKPNKTSLAYQDKQTYK